MNHIIFFNQTDSDILFYRFEIDKHYKTIRRIGVGTYASVTLAQCLSTGKLVAIKLARGNTSVELLKNEAKILKHVESEYFPELIQFNIDKFMNKAYLVMEYIEGSSLDEFWLNNDIVSEEQVWKYLRQVVEAIENMHSKGVVHRDIKPQNIIITKDNKVKIIDFNISKISTLLAQNKYNEANETWKFHGKFFTQISSPLFAAPEISTLDYYTESIDIWGIGIILLCLMNTKLIHSEKLDIRCILENVNEEFDWYSDSLIILLSKLLSNDANDRPWINELKDMVTN